MIDAACKEVIKQLKIETFVETGIYRAESTAEASIWFSENHEEFGVITDFKVIKGSNPWNTYTAYPIFTNAKDCIYKIYATDNHLPFIDDAKALFSSNPNVIFMHQSSEDALNDLINKKIVSEQKSFFFLDAHWYDYWPLRDELKIILNLPKCIIAIDDFQVPEHRHIRFDQYKKIKCNLSYISDLLIDHQVKIYYPTRANRDGSGWVLIFKGYKDEELEFLCNLPLFNATELRIHRKIYRFQKKLVNKILKYFKNYLKP
jgi:hypothetical protein